MKCPKCDNKIVENGKFCSFCGVSIVRDTSTQNNLNKHQKVISTPVALIISSVAVLLVVVYIYFIWANPPVPDPESYEYQVLVRPMRGEKNIDVKCNKSFEKLEVNGEIYSLSKSYSEDGLRAYLFDKAKGGGRGEIELFHEDKRKRLISISFDNSGSVNSIINAQRELGVANKYSDEVLSLIAKYIDRTGNIVPGDTIVAQLYGPPALTNACNQTITIKYEPPTYKARFVYLSRQKKVIVFVGEQIQIKDPEIGNIITTDNRNKIKQTINEFYDKGLTDPNAACHDSTHLGQHLKKLNNDPSLEDFSSRHFIITNDGKFSFLGSHSSPDQFAVLSPYINGYKSLFKEGDSICKQDGDTLTIMGINFGDNSVYEQKISEFFKVITAPCRVNFINI